MDVNNYVIIEGEGLVYWPMCKINGCPNRQCKSLGSVYCWPHTGNGKSPEETIESLTQSHALSHD